MGEDDARDRVRRGRVETGVEVGVLGTDDPLLLEDGHGFCERGLVVWELTRPGRCRA